MKKNYFIKDTTYDISDSDGFNDYVRFWVTLYIQKNATYKRSCCCSLTWVEPDFQTQLRLQILEETLEKFTPLDFLIIFDFQVYDNKITAKDLRREAIENINYNHWMIGEANINRFKNKIWDMSPTYFQLAYLLFKESDVFSSDAIFNPDNSKH